MSKTLIIVGGAIATVLVVGAGGYAMADSWLDDKAETEITNELQAATGGLANIGSADVQLLRQRVAVNDIQLDGVEGFRSENLLNIEQLTLDQPDLQAEEVSVKKAHIEGITINLNSDDLQLDQALMSLGHGGVDIGEMVEEAAAAEAATPSAGSQKSGFTIDELEIGAIAVNLDFTLPWEPERVQHSITIPATTLTNVTDENIAEQLMVALGEPAFQQLQAFAYQELVPTFLNEWSDAIPDDIDLSDISVPEGLELPESIELPDIKLPQGN